MIVNNILLHFLCELQTITSFNIFFYDISFIRYSENILGDSGCYTEHSDFFSLVTGYNIWLMYVVEWLLLINCQFIFICSTKHVSHPFSSGHAGVHDVGTSQGAGEWQSAITRAWNLLTRKGKNTEIVAGLYLAHKISIASSENLICELVPISV